MSGIILIRDITTRKNVKVVPGKSNLESAVINVRRGVSLYKQPNSKFWYVRVFMPFAGKRNHTKSTKTEDQRAAIKFAEEFFVEVSIQRRSLSGDTKYSARPPKNMEFAFSKIATNYLEILAKAAGKTPRKVRGVHDSERLIKSKNGLLAFFKNDDIASITTSRVRDYLNFAEEQSKAGSLSASTKSKHVVVLNQILRFAFEKGI